MESRIETGKERMKQRDVFVQETEWVAPESVFRALRGRDGLVWLDSGQGQGRTGRWSFIAWAPYATITGNGAGYAYSARDGAHIEGADPFELLRARLAEWTAQRGPAHPPFTGGVAGFFGYDLLRHCEPSTKLIKTSRAAEGDVWLGFYDRVIAFDNKRRTAYLVANADSAKEHGGLLAGMREVMDAAAERPAGKAWRETSEGGTPALSSNFTRAEYVRAVERVREYIEEGDCYQVNIAQRFSAPEVRGPHELYEKLRAINPAPFGAFIDTGRARILSSSPERFISLDGSHAQTRPIKGTRPRGATEAEDQRLMRELAASGKDRAENVMIVDLLRNDFSKVCAPDTVRVTELCAVESFPTVHHLVSTVTGRLREGFGPVELVRECFPGGSVTGAPKIRAMEIIDEIEPDPRGAYCGAAGYIGFDGNMDTSVLIRTMIHSENGYTFHAGGGVTWLSDAEAEYEETMDKAKALIEAVS